MHGRVKKDVVELPPEELAKQREQVRTARALFGKLLEQRQARAYSQQTLDMTSKALQFHPEFPTIWGYRREILLSGQLAGEGGSDAKAVLEGEMKLLEKALRKSQKVYSIWFHRKWAVERLFEVCGKDLAAAQQVLDTELELCGRLLEVDERNFHCWNHRAYVMGLMRRSLARPAEAVAAPEAAPSPPAAAATVAPAPVAAAPPAAAAPAAVAAQPTPAAAAPPGPAAAGYPAPPTPAAAQPTAPTPPVAPAAALAVTSPPPTAAPADAASTTAGGAGPPPAAAAPADAAPAAAGGGAGPPSAAEPAGEPPAPAAGEAEVAAPKPPPDLTAIDLKLSTELINRNFSNYSAWHLRALLQRPPPQDEGASQEPFKDPIDVCKELDWVQQGIYTEPNDQSVWLYHHWLTALGRGADRPRITHCALLGGELFVFFSERVCIARGGAEGDAGPEAKATVAGRSLTGRLLPLGPDPGSDATGVLRRTRPLPANRRRWVHGWRFVPAETAVEAEAVAGTEVKVEVFIEELGSHPDGRPAHGRQLVTFSGPAVVCDAEGAAAVSPALPSLLAAEADASRLAVLQGELARVEELLEIEPDCRWALLSRGRLATAAAAGSGREAVEAAARSVAAGYDRIAALDPLRKGFYAEAQGASELRLRSIAWVAKGDIAAPLDLKGIGLRHLPVGPVLGLFALRRLDLSDSGLQALGPVLQLLSLQELLAARNGLLGDLREAFCLPRLRRLDLSGNKLRLGPAEGGPSLPPDLQEVDASSNPAVLALLGEEVGAKAVLSRLGHAAAGWEVDGDAATGCCVLRRRG